MSQHDKQIDHKNVVAQTIVFVFVRGPLGLVSIP